MSSPTMARQETSQPAVTAPSTLSPARMVGLLALMTVLALLPFINKPFHIDDPLFIWAAQQIQQDPFDYYGTKVNWSWTDAPMSKINMNPPGVSYYLAAAALVVVGARWRSTALCCCRRC